MCCKVYDREIDSFPFLGSLLAASYDFVVVGFVVGLSVPASTSGISYLKIHNCGNTRTHNHHTHTHTHIP